MCLKRISQPQLDEARCEMKELEVDNGRDECKGLREKISAEERKDYHPNRIHLPDEA